MKRNYHKTGTPREDSQYQQIKTTRRNIQLRFLNAKFTFTINKSLDVGIFPSSKRAYLCKQSKTQSIIMFIGGNGKYVLFSLFLFLTACTNNSEEELYSDCETDNMSFQIHVSPYLENNCISCHNQNLSSGGIDYSRFAGIKSSIDNGSFLGSIKHETKYEAMPPNETKTDDCKINQIEAWIYQGAINN